jgi:hypothetical protein
MQVNRMHDIRQRHYENIAIISKTYTILYIDIVYDVVFDIVFLLYSIQELVQRLISVLVQSGILPVLDQDSADVITRSEHIVKAHADTRKVLIMRKDGDGRSRTTNFRARRL